MCAVVSKPNTFASGATIVASEHNDNYDTIYNEFNGNIDNANIKAGAAIAGSKIDFTSGVGAITASGNISFDGGTFIFNESGADKDFRVEGDTDANLLWTDAGNDRVCIGTSTALAKLHISNTNTNEAVYIEQLGELTAGEYALQVHTSKTQTNSPLVAIFSHSATSSKPALSISSSSTAGAIQIITPEPPTAPNINTIFGQSIVKAWCVFTGSGTAAILNAFNIASLTDNGTGDYTITWATTFTNATYCIMGTCSADNAGISIDMSNKPTVSAARILTRNYSGAAADDAYITIAAIGDQS